MTELFAGREAFNDCVRWDTSSVTSMRKMFYHCKSFNQPLNFDTLCVTDMSGMFYMCEAFDQPVVFTSTASVTSMCNMFSHCLQFNQPIVLDCPGNDCVVVEVAGAPTLGDQCRAFRLQIAALIGGSALQHGGLAVPSPRYAETSQAAG